MFFILRENVFNGLHQFPLSLQGKFAQIRNVIFSLQQVLEVNILLINRQFVGDDLLILADLRKVFVAQQMHGEADSRGAIFKQGGVASVCGISGGYRCCREIRIAGGRRGKGGFILMCVAGDHVPGALVVGQGVAITPGVIDGAFFWQVIEHREVGAYRLGVVFTAAGFFNACFFQRHIELEIGARCTFRSKPNHCILFAGFLSGLDHIKEFHVRSSFLGVRIPEPLIAPIG